MTAVDLDPLHVAAAPPLPGLQVHVGDITELAPDGEPFDAVVAAGNVFVFMAPGTEHVALHRIAALLRPGGLLVTGFAIGRAYSLTEFDADASAAGRQVRHRFGTWDLLPWRPDGDWAVTVLRRRP